MSKLILYHGSSEIIQNPEYGKGKSYNDYGKGFYCTEHQELAKEWACTENTDGFANQYEIETAGLSILNLSGEEYTILMHACFNRQTEIVQLLLDKLLEEYFNNDEEFKKFINAKDKTNNYTALMYACGEGYEEIVKENSKSYITPGDRGNE